MSELKLNFNNQNIFVDLTDESVAIQYAPEEYLDNHRFIHIKYGIFAADPIFEMNLQEFENLTNIYRNIDFVVSCSKENGNHKEHVYNIEEQFYQEQIFNREKQTSRIAFAYSKRWVNIDTPYEAIKNEECFKPYLKFLSNTTQTEDDIQILSYPFTQNHYKDNPSMKTANEAMKFQYTPIIKENGIRPWIMIAGDIGIMVEDGIYYFPLNSQDKDMSSFDDNKRLTTLCHFKGIKAAGLCYGIGNMSIAIGIKYLAIGEEHFTRLKEIEKMLDRYFYHEFYSDPRKDTLEPMEILELLGDFKLREEKEKQEPVPIEENAEELLQGFGYTKLDICFNIPFVKYQSFRNYGFYDAAYKLGTTLVLIKRVWENNKLIFQREEHDMRLMDLLCIQQETKLKCGITYPVIHEIIKCPKEKMQEILTPEAYALYLKEDNFPK